MAVFDWNLQSAEQIFKRAITLSPGNPEVYSSYAQFLRWLGRYEECISYAKKAIELNPLDPEVNGWLANFYTNAGQYRNAARQIEKTLELNSTLIPLHNWATIINTLMGSYEKAIPHIKIIEASPQYKDNPISISIISWAYSKSGNIMMARKYLEELEKLSEIEKIDPFYFAIALAGLEEKEEAINQLMKSVETHSGTSIYLKAYCDLFFNTICSDARYVELLRKVGFRVE